MNSTKIPNYFGEDYHLFSDKLAFKEIINYFRYQNEETKYLTMHKTKGSEKQNILVVLDEYFWNAYDFKAAFSGSDDLIKKRKNQKLVYVACSRAMKNLICVRLVENEHEEQEITGYFENVVKVDDI